MVPLLGLSVTVCDVSVGLDGRTKSGAAETEHQRGDLADVPLAGLQRELRVGGLGDVGSQRRALHPVDDHRFHRQELAVGRDDDRRARHFRLDRSLVDCDGSVERELLGVVALRADSRALGGAFDRVDLSLFGDQFGLHSVDCGSDGSCVGRRCRRACTRRCLGRCGVGAATPAKGDDNGDSDGGECGRHGTELPGNVHV
ncbi:MAG: hypothetical protein JWP06_153 [Candidatus Saccharibacteria bacterium]|nr:hypothetical protein [Candidatus Saccharibacteria bacterium]